MAPSIMWSRKGPFVLGSSTGDDRPILPVILSQERKIGRRESGS